VLAKHGEEVVGYGVLHWESFDLTFRERNIPEIIDLNVITAYQKQGIGSALIHACEGIARDHDYDIIGIGVELQPQYDQAQRLYRKLGYTPVEGVRPGTVLALCKRLGLP
jgi:ribosomal protein S18 acetylase RimI-like enzyme